MPTADPMLALLQQMVAEDPSRADSWRLIGRIYRQQNRMPEALDAFQRALSLQADNVAAHADLGELLTEVGNHRAASYHFDQVMLLGPSSGYAAKLVERGIRRAPNLRTDGENQNFNDREGRTIDKVGYEIQTFDGADDLDRRLNQLDLQANVIANRWRAFIEFGSLYNTNVSLTPISRELTGAASASFQGFLNPDVEMIALQRGDWRSGPIMRGYFTLNENSFQSLNLASFQPGAFLERDLSWAAYDSIARVDYVFSLDLLNGDRFGERHAITASYTTILPDTDVVYAYITTGLSNFAQDGVNPSRDSLDGLSLTAGVSRFFKTELPLLPTWTLGADTEWANTEGDDFRYRAVNFFGDATFQLAPRLSFIPRAGIGYRDYADFTGPISRDELTYRLSGRLRWKCNESLSISTIVGHDRFASDNKDFDTQRTEAGIVITVIR